MSEEQSSVANVDNTMPNPMYMEAINRVVKLPVVESTFQTATTIYEKVKDYNIITNLACSTAETIMIKTVNIGKPIATPIVNGLEYPIRKVDNVLCAGLNFVEDKVPSIRLPPGEIMNTTKEYITRTVTPAYEFVEPAVRSVYGRIEPAVQSAKSVIESTSSKAKSFVEPVVQPVLDKAQDIKDYGTQKAEEILYCIHENQIDTGECQECVQNRGTTGDLSPSSSSEYTGDQDI